MFRKIMAIHLNHGFFEIGNGLLKDHEQALRNGNPYPY